MRVKKSQSQSSSELRLKVESKEQEEANHLINTYPDFISQMGSLYFKNISPQEFKPFINIKSNVPIDVLVRQCIQKHWKLNQPRIVVLIVSNMGPIREWTNNKQINQFKRGIMKATENTNMWLLCNGFHIGSTALISDAVTNERTENKYRKKSVDKDSKLTIIGIANEKKMRYQLSKDSYKVEAPNEGFSDKDGKHELSPELTHYILVDDESEGQQSIDFINGFVKFLAKDSTRSGKPMDSFIMSTNELPVVVLVINGGFDCAQLVYDQIKAGIPVIVMRGTGGLADLLAFVDYEIEEECFGQWDQEFVDMYLKTELNMRIHKNFPKFKKSKESRRNGELFENKILSIVQESREKGHHYLTVINMLSSSSCNLENLTEYLLTALFKTQKSVVDLDELSKTFDELDEQKKQDLLKRRQEEKMAQLEKDIYLCVDWNCPEVAKREVLSREPLFVSNMDKKLFQQSLIKTNREQFVDLFLSQKFKLRSFISSARLKKMFRKIHNREFFKTVCWESILGRSIAMKQSEKFIHLEFNWLIEACTGIRFFCDVEELGLFSMATYPFSDREAERKALEYIIFWAMFDFKRTLVRILWKHSDQPIHLALIIAIVYQRLSWYVSEPGMNSDLKAESRVFINYAYNVLDIVYKDAPLLADQILKESCKDWNYKTPIDLAAYAKLRSFLCHPACQRSLTNAFHGNLIIREVRFGFLRIPSLIKILLSAFFFFPTYLWIKIKKEEIEVSPEDDVDFDDETDKQSDDKKDKQNTEEKKDDNKGEKDETLKHKLSSQLPIGGYDREIFIRNQPTPCVVIYELWNAPITKFWVFQLSYILYLSLFCTAVLYPRCGNFYLDITICIWTTLIMVDSIRNTYLQHIKYNNNPITMKIAEIAFYALILIIYVSGRLLGNQVFPGVGPYEMKVILSIALLYSFYVLITIFMPISSTLGPLLYRLKIMILVDFVNFIRLSILVMVSFGVVIQAILYPDMEVNAKALFMTLHRTLMSLFITPATEMVDNTECTKYTRNGTETYASDSQCFASIYTNTGCYIWGFWPYIFIVFYFVFLKLILLTTLFAIFASSSSALTADTDSIWKYQRYILVMDFVNRLPLPPPLNIFCYIFYGIRWLYHLLTCHREVKFFNRFGISKVFYVNPDFEQKSKLLNEDDYHYLKIITNEYYSGQENRINNDLFVKNIWERTQNNSQLIEYQTDLLRQIIVKLSEMGRSLNKIQTKSDIGLSPKTPSNFPTKISPKP